MFLLSSTAGSVSVPKLGSGRLETVLRGGSRESTSSRLTPSAQTTVLVLFTCSCTVYRGQWSYARVITTLVQTVTRLKP